MTAASAPRDLWHRPVSQLLTAGVLGALTVLAFAPFGFGLLAPLTLALWLLLCWQDQGRRAFRLGLAYGLGLMVPGVFWLHISIAQFGGVTLPLAVLATLLFAAIMALYVGAAAWLGMRLGRGRPAATLLLALPAAWVLLEWVRGWFLSGFPWLSLGYSQIDLPLAGLAPVLGLYGMGWAVLLSAGGLALLLSRWGAWPPATSRDAGPVARPARAPRLPLTLGVALGLLVLWGGAAALGQVGWTRPAGAPLAVGMVQGNIDQADKWDPASFQLTLDRYLGLTAEINARQADTRLILWPETAIPAFADQVELQLLTPLAEQAAARGQDILLGIPVREDSGDYFNAMLNIGASGRASYSKRHLVPFGEFMPLDSLLRPLAEVFAIPMSSFTAGAAAQPLVIGGGQPLGISICYEDAFGAEVRRALPAATLLVNASNDAWFGDSLAPHQHLEIARLRALESGRTLLRATNTGISAIIAPDGRLTQTAPQFAPAILTAQVQPRSGATPYVRWGDAPVITLASALLLLLATARYRHARRHSA